MRHVKKRGSVGPRSSLLKSERLAGIRKCGTVLASLPRAQSGPTTVSESALKCKRQQQKENCQWYQNSRLDPANQRPNRRSHSWCRHRDLAAGNSLGDALVLAERIVVTRGCAQTT